MKKKILALLCCAVAAVFMFTGCGGTGGGNSGGEWWNTTGALEKDDAGNVVFNNVEIKLSTVVNGEDKDPFNRIVAQFNAQYRGKINVVVTNIAEAYYESTVGQQIAYDLNAPDLLMSHEKGHKFFVQDRLIQPFDEIMEQSGIVFDMADYAEGLAKYSSMGTGDSLYGVPVDAQSMVVYYNKKILEKYADSFPSDRAGLISLLEKIAEGENMTPIAWSTTLGYFSQYLFATAVIQNGGYINNPDADDYLADWSSNPENNAAFKKAIASIRELIYHDPRPLAAVGQSEADALNSFLTGRAFIYVSLPWFIDSIAEGFGQLNGGIDPEVVKNDYLGAASLANWFTDEQNENSAKIYGDSHFFAMSATVRDINKKAAVCEFIRWFTQTGSVGASWADAGHMTASKVISESPEYQSSESVSKFISKFYSGIDNFECVGVTPFYGDINNALVDIILNTLEQADASKDDAAIKKAQDDYNAVVSFVGM